MHFKRGCGGIKPSFIFIRFKLLICCIFHYLLQSEWKSLQSVNEALVMILFTRLPPRILLGIELTMCLFPDPFARPSTNAPSQKWLRTKWKRKIPLATSPSSSDSTLMGAMGNVAVKDSAEDVAIEATIDHCRWSLLSVVGRCSLLSVSWLSFVLINVCCRRCRLATVCHQFTTVRHGIFLLLIYAASIISSTIIPSS